MPVTYKTKDGYVFKTLPTLENAYEKYNKLNTFTISEDKKTMTGNIIPDNDGDVKITVIAQQEEVIVTSSYINVFLPTDEQMTKLSRMRMHVVGDANGAVVDTFSYIRKLFQAFIPLEKTGEEEIKIADYFETGIMCSTTDVQLVIIKSDVMKINHKFNSIYDYEPFSTAKMYLPFVGIVDVGLNKLIDKNIYIEYACNVYTMNCVCRLYADDVLIDNFNGNFGVEFPYNCFSEDKTILDSKEYVYDLVPKIIITNKIPYEGEKIKSIDVTDLGKNFNGYIEGDKIYLDEITIKNRYSFITNSEISMIADCIKEGIYLWLQSTVINSKKSINLIYISSFDIILVEVNAFY